MIQGEGLDVEKRGGALRARRGDRLLRFRRVLTSFFGLTVNETNDLVCGVRKGPDSLTIIGLAERR